MPNKIIPIKPALIKPATLFLETLLDAQIIKRGYSTFNAQTYFIPKRKPELTKTEFLKRGGKEQDFVTGAPDENAPQGMRMVNDFTQLNAITRSHPVHQPSTTEQLKYISS